MTNRAVWLVGAGAMARAYAAVLVAMDLSPLVICRSKASADRFAAETGLRCIHGGVAAALDQEGGAPESAIIAIDVGQLAGATRDLMDAGCRRLLLEKPGGIDADDIDALAAKAASLDAQVYIAYNRRFYGSVMAVRQGLEADGGPVSMSFDFTEASDAVLKIGHPPALLKQWLLANSTHVIDTAFVLAGEPLDWSATTSGALDWHPRAARFAGHGVTEAGVLFSYLADWDAPGRWAIEISSRLRRFILKPMEQLQVQVRGSFQVQPVPLDGDLDVRFKPGLYLQTQAFLTGENRELLPTLAEHSRRVRTIYEPIATGAVPSA